MRDRVTVGFAAGMSGKGVAYAQIANANQLLRVPYAVRRTAPERAGAYAAATAVVRALIERGYERLEISVDDPLLHEELQRRREVPRALNLPYIQLGCLLNRLREFSFAGPSGSELTRRAESELTAPAAA